MTYPYLYPGECPTLDDIREAMAEHRPMGADTRSGLLGWWPGRHRGAILRDFSGNVHKGTWSGTGAHWAVDGERQGVVTTFNGTDDFVLTNYNAIIETNWSAVVWWDATTAPANVYPSALAQSQVTGVTGVNRGWLIGYKNTTTQFGITGPGVAEYCYTTGAVGSGWHCGVVTVSGTPKNISVYLDGNLNNTGNTNHTFGCAKYVSIGAEREGSVGRWKGAVDDCRLYTRALSAAEVKHIYDCGRVAPLSDLVEPVGWETVGVTGGVVVPWHLFGRVA